MKLTLAVVVLLAATATAQTKQGCKTSFYFVYTDRLGNEYADVQGKELRDVEQFLKKMQHGEICLADIHKDDSEAEYLFHVTAETRKQLWEGSEVFYTNYSLEVRLFLPPKTLLHTFARVPQARAYTAFYVHQPSENKVVIGLVEEAADWLDDYIKHRVVGSSPVPVSGATPASETSTTPKHYDHGTDESSFGLVAHVKVTEQRASQCISTVDIGNSGYAEWPRRAVQLQEEASQGTGAVQRSSIRSLLIASHFLDPSRSFGVRRVDAGPNSRTQLGSDVSPLRSSL